MNMTLFEMSLRQVTQSEMDGRVFMVCGSHSASVLAGGWQRIDVPICNSDPTLDFGDAARSQAVRLRSCISTPLLVGEHLAGVMTLYATEANAFTEDHRRIVELIAKQIAHLFTRSADRDSVSHRESIGPLPSHPSNRRAH